MLKDADWEHDHSFELVVSGHNTWWKCKCGKIATHPEVMAALERTTEQLAQKEARIRELEDALSWASPIMDELCELYMVEEWPEIKPATEYELMKMKNFTNPIDQALTHGKPKINALSEKSAQLDKEKNDAGK